MAMALPEIDNGLLNRPIMTRTQIWVHWQVVGLVEVFWRCFADVLNQSFIVLSVAQASILARVCWQSYSKKTANIALRHQRFPREMTFEERAQKFYTDDLQ